MAALSFSSAAFATGNVLSATASATTITCNTQSGTTPATITIKSLASFTGANSSITVSFATPLTGGITVTPSSATMLAAASGASGAGVTFTVGFAGGCAGVTNAAVSTIQFKQVTTTNGVAAAIANDVSQAMTTNLVATASGLSPSPATVTVSCVVTAGPAYAPGPAQTVSVLSTAANVGSPFTITSSGANAPATWLTVTGSGGTATTSSAVTFTVQAAAGCDSLTAGQSATTTVHLASSGASGIPDKLVTVVLQAVGPSPLNPISPVTITYVKGSGQAAKSSVTVSSTSVPGAFFAVDTTTMPTWLTVDYASGTAPKAIQFSSTTLCDSLAPGTYSATIKINVSGYGPLSVSVSLLITNTAPKLTVAEPITRSSTWTIGTSIPTPTITALSSDTPIPFTATAGGVLAQGIQLSVQSGLAYSFGTPINITFNPVIFASAAPNSVLTGTVTLKYGTNSSIVVTFIITVQSPGSTLTGVSPASLPTAPAGSRFLLGLTGTGFIVSSDPTQATKVGVVQSGTTMTPDPNITVTVQTASTIQLAITVNASDTLLPFSGSGGTVTLGVCNPSNGTCNSATGTVTLSIGSNPIIQAVTSSSALVQVTPPALPTISPYDMISIFGANFCPVCASNQVLPSTPDSVLMQYPTSVSFDAQHSITVTFYQHGTQTSLGQAPLLFATNSQINLVVPGGSLMSGQVGNEVDIVVAFGAGANLAKSAVFSVNLAATDPGVFTIGQDGQGSGAILDQNYNLITATNAAGARSASADSDIVQLYMTGLGIPDSAAANTTGGAGAWSGDCVSASNYLTTLAGVTGITTLDGTLVLTSPLVSGRLAPCLVSNGTDVPSVTIGGQTAAVKYAGWVSGVVAGLYQVNVQLPSSTAASGTFHTVAGATPTTLTAPVQLPVVVTSNSVQSQAGVSIWVAPSLKVEPIASDSSFTFVSSGTVGVAWASSNNAVVASEGTAPYRYAVTSGLLPSGLAINPTTGAITGTPAANTAGTYSITVTATDSATIPVTGTTTFTLTIAADLYVTNGTPYNSLVFGTAHAVATVTAAGGVAPYAYAITSAPVPTGVSVNQSTGVVSTTALTPAGNYTITVGATDATSGSALTGAATFSFGVALNVTKTPLASIASGATGELTHIQTTGATGTPAYALDATTLARGWIAIDPASGVITLTSAVSGNYSVTVTVTDPGTPTGGTGATTTYTFSFSI